MFGFDAVFCTDASTADVYQQSVQPVVAAVAQGKHGTVLAYGPTGSGKTYTMQGGQQAEGVVQLAVTDLLATCPESVLTAQFFEVYNEQVRDLLLLDKEEESPTPRRSNTGSMRPRSSSEEEDSVLNLSYEADGTATVQARSHGIQTVSDVVDLLQRGNRRRSSAATALNAQSSRSHAIFRLQLETRDGASVRRSVLNLVDLAGSENSKQAGISGMQKRETGKINQR